MFVEPDFLRFAGPATLAGVWGGALLLLAAVALVAERRRLKRTRIDAVGWMPWTAIFFVSGFMGFILLGVAVQGWRAG
ncbi:hypothetical protein [Altericroceibacterium xinjiangense]|uniref:hypothetical protein n=1 Tax=Altericroceibacterium xinjiangense TaxID=762261 RepID=UPI001F497430|nr:hypothetical protein [Altericroceibacterium xinjiangense]